MNSAVFLDRDGTISEEVGYLSDPDQLRLIPHSAEAIRLINENSLKTIIITNQAGVARGYFPEEMVSQVHQKMEKLLSARGAHLDDIYYCPHHPEGIVESYRKGCDCRKPASGLLKQASKEHGIDLTSSYMVGDKVTDMHLAHGVGARAILVLTGYGRDELEKIKKNSLKNPEYVACNLLDAAKWIIKDLGIAHSGDSDNKIECNR